jgi:hypothetical protein
VQCLHSSCSKSCVNKTSSPEPPGQPDNELLSPVPFEHAEAGIWDGTAVTGNAVLAQRFEHEAKAKELRKWKTRVTCKWDASSSEEEDGKDDLEETEGPPSTNPFNVIHATRQRMEKTLVATGFWSPKARKLDKFITRVEHDSVMNTLWQTKNKSGNIKSGPNKLGHALSHVLTTGQIDCEACSVHVPRKRVTQHIIGSVQATKLKRLGNRNLKRQKTLHHVEKKKGPIGKCLTAENEARCIEAFGSNVSLGQHASLGRATDFNNEARRIEMLQAAFGSNVSMGQRASLGRATDFNNKSGLSLGNCAELARTHGKDTRKLELQRIETTIKGCFPEFATISDGTPTFAKAEATKLRMVR